MKAHFFFAPHILVIIPTIEVEVYEDMVAVTASWLSMNLTVIIE